MPDEYSSISLSVEWNDDENEMAKFAFVAAAAAAALTVQSRHQPDFVAGCRHRIPSWINFSIPLYGKFAGKC